MSRILIYTFRTFPYMSQLRQEFSDIFILDKLKQDINYLCKTLQKKESLTIIGVAKASKKYNYSQIETIALNKFAQRKKIDGNGPLHVALNVPNKIILECFRIRRTGTMAFCNYAMYKIQLCILTNKLKVKHIFLHIKPEHIKCIKKLLYMNQWQYDL